MLFENLQALIDAIVALSVDLTEDQRTAEVDRLITEGVTAENLTAWRDEAATAARTIAAGDNLTDDDLVTLTILRETNVALASWVDVVTYADDARVAAAAALVEDIRGADGDPDGGDPAADPDADPAADPATDPAADPTADPDAVPDPAADPTADPDAVPADVDPALAPEAVAASSARQRSIRAAARRPGVVRLPGQRVPGAPAAGSVLPDDIGDWGLVASANVPNAPAGGRINSREDLSQAFLSAINASRAMAPGTPPVDVPLFTMGGDGSREALMALGYEPDRILGRDEQRNFALMQRVASDRAIMNAGGFETIAASGGICAPQQVNYDQDVIGDASRPIRDSATVRFGAERGGIRMFPPVLLDEVEGAVSLWTAANDADPGSNGPAVKPCLTMTCPDDDEALVAAIVQCLRIGNFRSRYFGEQVEAWLRLTAVWQARFAERRLFQQILDDSDTVTYSAETLGTLPEVLSGLFLAESGMRSTPRIQGMPLRWIVPFWLPNQMAVDQARSMPAGTFDERFALSEATINRLLAGHMITPTYAFDGPEDDLGQEFPRQGDGPLIGWPDVARTALYPEGSHLFLDGGQIDFGIVRDSVLNQTNDFVMMSESMEGHWYHGQISYDLTFDTCPSGTRAALADNSGVCVAGS